jgi:hypothetical protein
VIAQQMWQMRQGKLRDARSIATTAFVPRCDDIQNNRACIAINTQGALAALLRRPVAAHVHVPSAANRHGCKMDWLAVAVSSHINRSTSQERHDDFLKRMYAWYGLRHYSTGNSPILKDPCCRQNS